MRKQVTDRLRPLSALRSTSGIGMVKQAMSPGSHCPMHTAMSLAGQIWGLSTLVVGTPECAVYSRMVADSFAQESGGFHWTYTLSDDETVFGCRKGLLSALREMDQSGAAAVLIIFTCVPELIGEDPEALIHELQPAVTARLLPVLLAHFRCISYPEGFSKTLLQMGRLMQRRPVLKDTVNLIGAPPGIRNNTAFTALKAEKKRMRILGAGADLSDFIDAPDAAVNVVCAAYGLPLALWMQKKWNLPFIRLYDCYSPADISGEMARLQKALHLTSGEAVRQRAAEIAEREERIREQCAGQRFALVPHSLHCLSLAAYLTELGLVPVFLHLEEYTKEDGCHAERILTAGQDPAVGHCDRQGISKNALSSLQPDLYFGNVTDTEKEDILLNPDALQRFFGFDRTAALLDMLETASAERKGLYGA